MSDSVKVSLDALPLSYCQPVRSALTGGDVFRDRPAACADPLKSIYGLEEVEAKIADAMQHLADLRDGLQGCKLKAIGVEEAKVALTRAASRGEPIPAGEAVRLDLERQEHVATAQIIEAAIVAAQGDLKAARRHRKVVLKRAADSYLDILREMLGESSRELQQVRNKQAALESWAREVQTMLQHDLDEDQLQLVLGIA